MHSHEIFNGGASETYPLRTVTDAYVGDTQRFFNAATAANLPVVEYAESITDPAEREQNELSTAEAMIWYMTGVDMKSDGYMNSGQLVRLGDMTARAFDDSPQGILFWNIVDHDYMWSLIRGSENAEVNTAAYAELNPGRNMEIARERAPMSLGTLEPGEPWNEYQQLMIAQADNWGGEIDYRDIVGQVRITSQKEVLKPFRHMTFEQANMLRTGEGVRHMSVEVGFSKEKVGMAGRGVQMNATYDWVSNPSISVRDFRDEVERIGIAMRIQLFIEITDFLLREAAVHSTNDQIYGNLQNITADKWLQWRKLWNRYQMTTFIGDPISVTKWELTMLGARGDAHTIGVAQLVNMLQTARNNRQLNTGSQIPQYGWIDNVYSAELYNKFTDSDTTGLNNNGGEKYGLFFNRPTASRFWFRRQSRQDETGRDTQGRYIYRDLHTEIGKDRIEKPETGRSNIIRARIS